MTQIESKSSLLAHSNGNFARKGGGTKPFSRIEHFKLDKDIERHKTKLTGRGSRLVTDATHIKTGYTIRTPQCNSKVNIDNLRTELQDKPDTIRLVVTAAKLTENPDKRIAATQIRVKAQVGFGTDKPLQTWRLNDNQWTFSSSKEFPTDDDGTAKQYFQRIVRTSTDNNNETERKASPAIPNRTPTQKQGGLPAAAEPTAREAGARAKMQSSRRQVRATNTERDSSKSKKGFFSRIFRSFKGKSTTAALRSEAKKITLRSRA